MVGFSIYTAEHKVADEMGLLSASGRNVVSRQQGVTYLVVLFIIAGMGLWLSAIGTLWSTVTRRAQESALIDVGHAYRDAIRRYYESSPGIVKRYPVELSDLLLDRRFVQTKRYLRKLYPDPITGDMKWGTVPAPDGGIMGVHSLSEETPIKVDGFVPADAELAGKVRYLDWIFVYVPQSISGSQINR